MLPTVAHYTRLHLDNGDTPIDLHLTIEIMKISNSNQVNFIILCSFFRSITITLWIQLQHEMVSILLIHYLKFSAKLRQLAGQTQDNFNFGPSLLKF